MVFQICLAGQVIEIHSLYEEVHKLCKEYLACGQLVQQPALVIKIREEEIKAENDLEQTMRTDIPLNMYRYFNPGILEFFVLYKRIANRMPDYEAFVMHGAAIASNGQAFMFVAPSGTGKTTRLRLWEEEIPGSIVVNGDKPLVYIHDDNVFVCGTPWCGKEGWNTNITVPLHTIFLLERVEQGEKTTVTEITKEDALSSLLEQVFFPNDTFGKMKTLYLLQKMSQKVKIFRFRSELTGDAVRLAWETAKKNI